MVKHLIELALQTARVTLRALQKTAAEEAAAAKQARAQRLADKTKAAEEAKNNPKAEDSKKSIGASLKNQMHLKEATDILDVDIYPDMKKEEILAIQSKYDKMYSNNKWIASDRKKPTYLQSKVYRAKERVDMELSKLGHNVDEIYASAEK